jgi:hypothetical protein
MPRYNPTQLEELGRIGDTMLDQVRRVLREDPNDPAAFLTALRRLRTVYSTAGAAFVIRGWLDAVITASPTIEPGTRPYAIAFVNDEGTGFDNPAGMDEEYRWAATALSARLSDEQVILYRMFDKLPDDRRIDGYLLRVAELVGGILNAYETPAAGEQFRPGDVVDATVIATTTVTTF